MEASGRNRREIGKGQRAWKFINPPVRVVRGHAGRRRFGNRRGCG